MATATITTAIVTGSGRGIGRATALLLAREKGANIVVCSRTKSEVESTVDEIKKSQGDVLGVVCDVGVASQVDVLVKRTVERFGLVNVLVNNAGIYFPKRLVDTSEKEWDDTINCNLKGAFLCSKAVLPHLAKTGTIINVSSGAGKTGFENLSAYCASKFGMIGLTESLSWEVGGSVRVMSICPGEVDTRMQEKSDPEYYQENKSKMLRPEQVAKKIAEMIFDKKSYRNGESIDI
ncbi:MAG TPA: SDR family oxidoreductase [Nitrososphaera sp.]|nr:SDR family oxidoreductase [Nitrososphaera sp.]